MVANRVIILEPWWNTSLEDQAFGRVYRHGQTKETHLVRIIAKDTIDYRIVTLQQQKIDIIERMLEEVPELEVVSGTDNSPLDDAAEVVGEDLVQELLGMNLVNNNGDVDEVDDDDDEV